MTPERAEYVEAALHLAKVLQHVVTRVPLSVDDDVHDLAEAKGQYYYEIEPQHRWILGPGGKAGNCDLCIENEEAGWLPEDVDFPNTSFPHPNCTCAIEDKDRRVRYSYFDKD